jgi:hypothetical protein
LYPVIGELPLAGATQETVILVPDALAEGELSGDGAATTTAFEANDRAEDPTALEASTLTV